MIKKQFTLYLENKPGELARITKILAGSKINIEGLSLTTTTDVALIQLVPNNATKTKRILTKAHIPHTVQDVAVVCLADEPGALSRISSKIAEAGLNINYVYATGCKCEKSCHAYAIISAPNLKKVVAAWGKSV